MNRHHPCCLVTTAQITYGKSASTYMNQVPPNPALHHHAPHCRIRIRIHPRGISTRCTYIHRYTFGHPAWRYCMYPPTVHIDVHVFRANNPKRCQWVTRLVPAGVVLCATTGGVFGNWVGMSLHTINGAEED